MPLFRWTRLPAGSSIADIDQRLSWPHTLILGTQYFTVMLGAMVAALLMGFDPSLSLLMCGISTLLFYVVTAGRVPSFMGTSGVFVGAVIALTDYDGQGGNAHLGAVLGGILFCGAATFLLGITVRRFGTRWIMALLPPVVTGTILLLVGTSLASIPATMHDGTPFGTGILLATAALLAVLLTSRHQFVRRIALLAALLIGTLVHALSGSALSLAAPISLQPLTQAAWFGLPAFQAPRLDVATSMTLLPLVLVLAVETLTHVKTVGDMTGRDLQGQMGNALVADGVGTMLSGSSGGPPMTSYAENVGLMATTRVYSTAVLVVAGILAVVLGLSPKLGAVLRLIPAPVLGGVVLVMFGMIAIAGIRMLHDHAVDLRQPRNQVIVLVPLMLGAGHFSLSLGALTFDGVSVASVAAIALQAMLPRRAGP